MPRSKRRTKQEVDRIREEVRTAMEKPRGEPLPPSGIGFAPSSKCCHAPVTIAGDDEEGTHYYLCAQCGEACDLV